MFAVLDTGGKQIKVEAGRYIDIEKLPEQEGGKVSFGNIVMLISGKDSKVGTPYIKGAVVNGHVLKQGKEKKVIVYKMKPKKRTRIKKGHRQLFSRVFIDNIELDGKVLSKSEENKQITKSKVTKPVKE